MGWLPPSLWTEPGARAYRVHMLRDAADIFVSCEDAGCDKWFGWETVCNEAIDTDLEVAMVIRSGETKRDYLESREVRGGVTVAVFLFGPGQECFESPHRVRARPARLLVHQGGRIVREHTRLRFLAEDYTEHVGRLAEQEKRG